MEDLKDEIYVKTMQYFSEQDLKPSENLPFLHFMLDNPNLLKELTIVEAHSVFKTRKVGINK